MELSERLQQLRKENGFSQEQLAEQLGVSRQAVSKWESGQSNPDIINLEKLCGIYHVSADYILTGNASIPSAAPPPCPEKKPMNPAAKWLLVVLILMLGLTVCAALFLCTMFFFITRF